MFTVFILGPLPVILLVDLVFTVSFTLFNLFLVVVAFLSQVIKILDSPLTGNFCDRQVYSLNSGIVNLRSYYQ